MVIERMICLSNGSSALPVEVRQNDYNAANIRLLVYETPNALLDMDGMIATVSYEKDGVPSELYEARVEEKNYLRFTFPASMAAEAGKGLMQIALYAQDAIVHSYTMPFVVEHSIPSPVPGTAKDPAPAFFSLIKEGSDMIDRASNVLQNPPYINEQNIWVLWDPNNAAYIITGKPSLPTLTVKVATGDPGTNATVEQTGTPEKPVWLFTLPRGEKGFTEGVDYSDEPPKELQTDAKSGKATSVSRSDHVHPLPGIKELQGVLPIKSGGTGADNAEEALENLGAASVQYVAQEIGKKAERANYTATLPASGWSDTTPYEQIVEVPGLLFTDVPLVDLDMSGAADGEAGTALQEAWTFVGRLSAGDGTITAYCYEEKPAVDIPIILLVVR